MQSETADFDSDTAICRTGRNISVVFDSDPFDTLFENTTSQNRNYITHCVCIAIREVSSHGHG